MGTSHSKDDNLPEHRRSTSKKLPSLLKKCSTSDGIDVGGGTGGVSNMSRHNAARATYPYPRGHSTVLLPVNGSSTRTAPAPSGIRAPGAKRPTFSRRAVTLNIPSPVPSGSEPSTTDNSANVSRSETREFAAEDALKEPDEEKRILKPIVIAEALSGLQEKECGGGRLENDVQPVPNDPSTSSVAAVATSRTSPLKTVAFVTSSSNKSASSAVVEKPVLLSKSLPAPRSILKAQSMEFTGKSTSTSQQQTKGATTKIIRPTSLRHADLVVVKSSKSAPSNLKGVAPLAESECFVVENSPAVEFPPSSFPAASVSGQKQAPLPISKLATKSHSSLSNLNKISSSTSTSKIGQSKLAQPTTTKNSSSDGKTTTTLHSNLTNLAANSRGTSFAESRLKNSSSYLRTQKIIYAKNEPPPPPQNVVDVNKKNVEINNKVDDGVMKKNNNNNNNVSSNELENDAQEKVNNNSALLTSMSAEDAVAATSKRQFFASSKPTSNKIQTANIVETKKIRAESGGGGSPKPPTTKTIGKNKNVLLSGGEIEFNNRKASLSDSVLAPKHEMHDSGVKTSDNSGGSDASNSKVTSPDGSIHRGLIDDEIKDQPDLTVGSQLDHQSSDQTLSGNESGTNMDKGSTAGSIRYRERIRKRSSVVDRMTESYDSTISSASVDDDDLMLDFEGSVDFGESVDLIESVYANSISGRKSLKSSSLRKKSNAKRASLEVVMDEFNNLVHEVSRSSSQSQRLRSVSDVQTTNSPPNCTKITRPLKPPASLSIDCAGLTSVNVDQHTYRHLIQDVTVLKTLLFRLKRVLQETDTVNPFESSLAMKNGLLKTGLDEILNDQTLTAEFTKDDLKEENATLRTQIALMRQQLDEKDKTISEQKQRIVELERVHKFVPQLKIPDGGLVKLSSLNCDKTNGRLITTTQTSVATDSPSRRPSSPTKTLSTDV